MIERLTDADLLHDKFLIIEALNLIGPEDIKNNVELAPKLLMLQDQINKSLQRIRSNTEENIGDTLIEIESCNVKIENFKIENRIKLIKGQDLTLENMDDLILPIVISAEYIQKLHRKLEVVENTLAINPPVAENIVDIPVEG